jgi:hypothetical protein
VRENRAKNPVREVKFEKKQRELKIFVRKDRMFIKLYFWDKVADENGTEGQVECKKK